MTALSIAVDSPDDANSVRALLIDPILAKRAGPVRIMFIGDTSESVRNDEKDFRKFDWGPIEVLDSHLPKTFDEWKIAVEFAAKKCGFHYCRELPEDLAQKGPTDFDDQEMEHQIADGI